MAFVCSYCGSTHFEIDDLDHNTVICQNCDMKQHLAPHIYEDYRPLEPHQQQLTCQQLLRYTDIVETIAMAAFMDTYYTWRKYDDDYQPDPVDDLYKSRSWLMTYCNIYRDLLNAAPEANEDGHVLFSWFFDDSREDNTDDVFLFSPDEYRILPSGKHSFPRYVVDTLTPEQCAGLIVPRALLNQVPLGNIAVNVLLEYGWHGSSHSSRGSWLCMFKAAERRLAEMAEEQLPFYKKDLNTTLEHSVQELQQNKQNDFLTIERVLEEFSMSFDQYDTFMQQAPHAVHLVDEISLPDLRQTLQLLHTLGYTQEELCQLYTAAPSLLTWSYERAKIGFTWQGAQMTRLMARLKPYILEDLMEHSLQMEAKDDLSPLYIPVTPDRIRYVMEQQLDVQLKLSNDDPLAESLEMESVSPLYLLGRDRELRLVYCVNDSWNTVPLSAVSAFSITDFHSDVPFPMQQEIRRAVSRLEAMGQCVWPIPHRLV